MKQKNEQLFNKPVDLDNESQLFFNSNFLNHTINNKIIFNKHLYQQTTKLKVDFHKISENSKILFLNISLKPSSKNTARFLKYVWPFYNIMHERVKIKKQNILYVHVMPRDTEYLSVFSPNTGKYGPEKTLYLDSFHTVYNLKR